VCVCVCVCVRCDKSCACFMRVSTRVYENERL
jgi:hypothetical protein